MLRRTAPALLALLAACSPSSTTAPQPAPAPDEEPASPAAAPLVAATLGTAATVHEAGGVWLASQPSPDDLALAAERGVRTLIDLRHDEETPELDAQAAAAAAGLEFLGVPFNGPDELTDEVFDRVRELLRTAERPLILSCGSSNRVGAVWLPFRVLDEGVPLERAVAEARTAGLRSDAYEALARAYVAAHGGGAADGR